MSSRISPKPAGRQLQIVPFGRHRGPSLAADFVKETVDPLPQIGADILRLVEKLVLRAFIFMLLRFGKPGQHGGKGLFADNRLVAACQRQNRADDRAQEGRVKRCRRT